MIRNFGTISYYMKRNFELMSNLCDFEARRVVALRKMIFITTRKRVLLMGLSGNHSRGYNKSQC